MKRMKEILLGAAGAYLAAILPRLGHHPKELAVRYYAHRGLHDLQQGVPENSLPAFKRAVEAGFGIELDVQMTKDGQVVVFHDFDLKRAAGVDRQIDSYTYEELQSVPLFASREKVPLFSEVLSLVNGQVPLIVEIKYKNITAGVCEAVQKLLKNYPGPYCIESFHPQALMWFRRYAPQVTRGQLAMRPRDMEKGRKPQYAVAEHLLLNWATKPDFIAYDIRGRYSLSKNLCRKLYGCPSIAWTVQTKKELEEVRRYYDYFIFEGFYPEVSG